MAYARRRASVNAELAEGATDGGYKKIVSNRGGIVEHTFVAARRNLDDIRYGLHEAHTKELPDGTVRPTPDYTPTAPPRYL
jgi:hypothetical protein